MKAGGFTLLEVMISLAILAVALVSISDLNGGAVAMHAYGRRATEATLLLRGKMLDLEDDLQKKGFSDFNDEQHGTFDEDGAPDYSWSAEILKPDVQLDPAQLLNMLGAGGNGGGQQTGGIGAAATALASAMGGAQGALQGLQGGGAAAMLAGPLGGVLQGQAKTFIETLKKSVREVRLTVSWQDGKQKQNVTASQIVVILPESVGAADKVQPVQQLNTQQQNLGQMPLTPKPIPSDPGQAQ
ncbi:MAG: prepilin-type N-terminal cleavage/methylation domain-containing protein [Myxococcales bacterium]|nr:prepilin-type N-terminal cleavage/methylation domain-containing protein [Myxococcales bacterium]